MKLTLDKLWQIGKKKTEEMKTGKDTIPLDCSSVDFTEQSRLAHLEINGETYFPAQQGELWNLDTIWSPPDQVREKVRADGELQMTLMEE